MDTERSPDLTVFVVPATLPPPPGLDQAPVGPLNPFLSPGPALSTFGGFALPFGTSAVEQLLPVVSLTVSTSGQQVQ